MKQTYDYIIAGSGAAGFSLLFGLLSDEKLCKKNILVLDRDEKKTNDRTWCFWEKEAGVFEKIVHHRWKKLIFHGAHFSRTLPLKNYQYKMIRGIDFYQHVLARAQNFTNVTIKYEAIERIESSAEYGIVKTAGGIYEAPYVFNSTDLFNPEMNTENSLLQHFMGWVIKTPAANFDKNVGTLMDFRLNQKHGDTFMYVLPTHKDTALIEYTLFTKKLLAKEEYEQALSDYIKEYLNIEAYEIVETEYGVIPMSLARFERKPAAQKCIYNIGTAGGFTKASSGYTFQFIQKNTASIIQSLKNNTPINHAPTFREKVFHWYDRTLLDVIISKKSTGKNIFSIMFKHLPADAILKFLGNESSLWEDIKIMVRLPILSFMVSGVKQLRIFRKK